VNCLLEISKGKTGDVGGNGGGFNSIQRYTTRILPATALIFRGDARHTANPDTTLSPAPSKNAAV
jgi:hypothetical protein